MIMQGTLMTHVRGVGDREAREAMASPLFERMIVMVVNKYVQW